MINLRFRELEVKPCPFCGFSGRICKDLDAQTHGIYLARVVCSHCHATVEGDYKKSLLRAELSAVMLWNSRAEQVVHCMDCKWQGTAGCAIDITDQSDIPKDYDYCSFGELKER